MDDAATCETVAHDASRYSALAQAFGDSAAPPHLLSGETLLDFRARLASKFKQHHPEYRASNLFTIGDSAAMSAVVDSIYSAAEKAMQLPTGGLRSVTTNENGHRITRFFGDPTICWSPFMGGHTRFVKFITNPGRK